MTDTVSPASAVIVAFVVTVVILSALRPIAKAIGLVDKPGGRKTHVGEVPIIGGVAMFAGMFAAFTLIPGNFPWVPLFVASAILVIVGAVDDRFHIPPAIRILTQIAVVLLMVQGAGMSLLSIGDPFGTGDVSMGRFAFIFTLLVTLTVINAYNLIDGADGLAGSLALIAMLSIAAVVGFGHFASAIALTVSCAVVGFLIFNFPTPWNRLARTFMGDAGSTLLGFTIVWIALSVSQGSERIVSPVICLWFASIPIYDLLTCFIRRALKGKSPFTPGRDHFHHKLMRGGFGVRRTLGILTALQVGYAATGIVAHFNGVPDFVMFVGWLFFGVTQEYVIKAAARYNRARQLRKIAT